MANSVCGFTVKVRNITMDLYCFAAYLKTTPERVRWFWSYHRRTGKTDTEILNHYMEKFGQNKPARVIKSFRRYKMRHYAE